MIECLCWVVIIACRFWDWGQPLHLWIYIYRYRPYSCTVHVLMQRHFVTRKQISMPYMCYLGLIHIPWNFTALIDLSIFICLTSLHTSDWQRWMCLKLLNDTTRHNVCSSILQWQQTIEIYCIVTVFVWNHGWVIIENDCFTMILQAGYPRGSAVARGVKNLPSPHTQSFTTRQAPLNLTNNNNNLSEHHCHITSNRELLEIN